MNHQIKSFYLLIEKLNREKDSKILSLRDFNGELGSEIEKEDECQKKLIEQDNNYKMVTSVIQLDCWFSFRKELEKESVLLKQKIIDLKTKILQTQKEIYSLDKKIELVTKKVHEFERNIDNKSQKKLDDEIAINFLLLNRRKKEQEEAEDN